MHITRGRAPADCAPGCTRGGSIKRIHSPPVAASGVLGLREAINDGWIRFGGPRGDFLYL